MRVRKNVLLLALTVFLVSCAGTQPSTKSTQPTTSTDALLKYQDEITVNFLRKHLRAFSHDSMRGREAGTPAEDMAARYLAKQYREMGLKPVGDNNSYFQHFKLNATKRDSVVYKLYRTSGKTKELVHQSTASKNSSAKFIRQFGGTDSLKGKVIFAGFGVNDPSRNIAHLKGADLRGKWVMVFQEIPSVTNGDTLLSPSIDAESRFRSIMGRGAEGILLIPVATSKEFNRLSQQMQDSFGEIGRMSLAYRDQERGDSGRFSKGYNLISPDLAARMLDLESESALSDYRKKLIGSISEFQPKALSYELSHIPYSSELTINSQNVLAFYEGADPKLKDEVVVMTSHYDHVGIGKPDSTGDRIYNGADDDGSGTVGLLNIAHAFVTAGKNGVKPRRSILFLNVSAEEKGLLGSRYYSDHPVFPMDKTVANINTDMIGRVDERHKKRGVEDYAYIIGAEIISSQLDSLVVAANKMSGKIELSKRYNDLQDPNQFYRRSDHWNFGRKGVPFVFFFTGVHEDYHRPSDEFHKIRFDKMSKIVRTMYATAVLVANTDNAPEVDNQEFIEITKQRNR